MKCLPAISAIAALGLVACDTMSSPITNGGYNPLGAPGGSMGANIVTANTFKAGQFVKTSMDNTGFYRSRPNGNANADKLLPRGTSMKVVTTSGSYVKAELDSGEIGFVPTVMLEDPKAAASVPVINPGEYQVYPPLPGAGEPLPTVDPAGLPPAGSIPTVIEPDDPGKPQPAPVVTPSSETFPTPPVQESVPLPPAQ